MSVAGTTMIVNSVVQGIRSEDKSEFEWAKILSGLLLREPDFGVTSVNYDLAELLARAEAPA